MSNRLIARLRRSMRVLDATPRRRLSGRLASGWRAYLIRTVTGEVGPAIDPTSGSWSIELNGTESGSITLHKRDLDTIEDKWLTPWWGGVLLTYTFEGVERPIVAGPITGWPSENEDELGIEFAGIRRLLAGRVVRVEGARNADMVVIRDVSRATMARKLVEVCLNKTGGGLPIVYGTPAEDQPGTYRQFEAWNLANASLDKRLQEITDEADGPDIMFRPVFRDDGRSRIVWKMVTGTISNPTIAQTEIPDWDTTPARSNISGISVKSSADKVATRVWATGAGEGAATKVAAAEAFAFINAGGPLIEAVVSDTDAAADHEVQRTARATLAASEDMIDQISIQCQANDAKAPLGTWFVGDKGSIRLKGWISIPDGRHDLRIIKASGDLTNKVSLEFQEDNF